MINLELLNNYVDIGILSYLLSILFSSLIFNFIIRKIVLNLIKGVLSRKAPAVLNQLQQLKLFKTLGIIAPFFIGYIALKYFPYDGSTQQQINFLLNGINLILVVGFLQIINIVITLIIDQAKRKYNNAATMLRTIAQVIRIILVVAGIISVVSIILNKSPFVILSGLGALTAVFMLVFKDSILGFASSIQVTLLDNVRVGDWIEMPKYQADGNVIDINISSIKVQNWDKTITTIPTYALVSDPVKNWRGMEEARARRISRQILIDINSIKFLTNADVEAFNKVTLLKDYLARSSNEINEYNQNVEHNTEPLNTRQLTNIGLFRNYLSNYLKGHKSVNEEQTILVRQQEMTSTGIPMQIYCFTHTTDWVEYEAVQSDIFDHIFASIRSFGLKVYQRDNNNSI